MHSEKTPLISLFRALPGLLLNRPGHSRARQLPTGCRPTPPTVSAPLSSGHSASGRMTDHSRNARDNEFNATLPE